MEQFIPLVTRKFSVKIPINDIVYIRRTERKLKIVIIDGEYEFYEKLEAIEPMLDQRFFHCLKYLIVNLEKVDKMEDNKIFFNNGEIFYLGRNNYVRSKQTYAAYLRGLAQKSISGN